jgi:biotin carboxylase
MVETKGKIMKKILVINLGWEQEPLLDKLEEYDVEIYGIHYDENYYQTPKYKDVFITDLRNLEKILDYAKQIKPDAVISDECDYSYFAQALVAENLDLPGPRVKEALIATNKYLQRQKAKEQNILIPEFKLCTSIDDVFNFANDVGFPIITKPVDNRGSFGVNKISSYNEIKSAFENAIINSHSRLVIVEKFIEGIHVTVDGYIHRKMGHKSLALAQKQLASEKDGKTQVALNIKYPATFKDELYEKILKTNEIVNKKLGFNFGMTHSEYMVTKNNDIYLIESANRGGGVYTSSLIVPNVTNINIIDQYICDSLKIKKNFFNKAIKKNDVTLKFFSFHEGKIKNIIINGDFKNKEEILKFKLFIANGDEIHRITTDASRHGFIITKNDNSNLDLELRKIIRIDYEK